ncbi:ADP-ribosylglycohydrolase family protein [Poriferisphaera sp. WC338]|uniref:ADP-ribosylglycohydrolase family protein n=1 Tax=Poriferisphaera sp. WC338 TaxID=3425129 RepID=UPI003D81833E
MDTSQKIKGCILGTAVGDALGLPREGISQRRAKKLFSNKPIEHTLLLKRGLCSDDTEHTIMVAQAYIASQGQPDEFRRQFAKRLRWWFVRLPAGVGLGTLRACIKLWLGFGKHSGVKSAGNGPAMRSALLGILAQDDTHLRDLIKASTLITHTDPRAFQGALLIATATHILTSNTQPILESVDLLEDLLAVASDNELINHLQKAQASLSQNQLPVEYAKSIGLNNGISGYINHTVPVALYCWLFNRNNFRAAVEDAIKLGGDTDTIAAIVGALAGTEYGVASIPSDWINNLAEWPCSTQWLTELSEALTDGHSNQKPPTVNPICLLIRNIAFIPIVLGHGLRRLAPPY